MKLLESKVAIITGGSRGIGKSICETFAQNGCDVAFTYNNSKDSAEALAKELNIGTVHVSLSHEEDKAIAFTISEIDK